ncbi:unnamed protein product [Symbiodinium pilosum]|uniref:Uncharacterized protein n=1 Tax=Symbiodinium pilosum TaxID=2952 RepID=A0A812WGN2_SYMPI|nr:unnamed protein product [Symbiodinium pilosum]
MTTSFVSQQTQLFHEVWRSIGLEIIIFVVTLVCAFAVRRFSPSPRKDCFPEGLRCAEACSAAEALRTGEAPSAH